MAVGRGEVLPNTTIQPSVQFRDFSFQQSFFLTWQFCYCILKLWKGLLRDEDWYTKCKRITFLSPNKMLRIERKLFPRLVAKTVKEVS